VFINKLNAEVGQFITHLNFYSSIWNEKNYEIIRVGRVLADIQTIHPPTLSRNADTENSHKECPEMVTSRRTSINSQG
jgi:hypothetical protein